MKDLFLNQIRFDLMFKYLYIKNLEFEKNTEFFKNLYLEHIRVFNNFYEREPSKIKASDFLNGYKELYNSLKKYGFDEKNPIPVNGELQITNGAHRLSASFALGLNVVVEEGSRKFSSKSYNYEFFRRKHINSLYADYAALEYVRLNPNSFIVNIQPASSPEFDKEAEKILEKYGFIYYKKNIFVSFNGLVNLKKLFYGEEKWIGNLQNDFKGAKKHAKNSSGPYPLRAYIFVCDDIKNVRRAKEEIRKVYNIGKNSVHINDTHKEAIRIAECYFNDNSLFVLNNRPYNFEDKLFDSMLMKLPPDICCAGSSPMNVFGIRKSRDIDFLSLNPTGLENEHAGAWESYYPYNRAEIILNPENYFYYNGVKFITLEVLKKMKTERGEEKDLRDIELIERFQAAAVDYSAIQNTNFEIYQDILQKLISSIRAEVLFKTSLRRRILNKLFPEREKYRLYKYKILSKICLGKKRRHYVEKLRQMCY